MLKINLSILFIILLSSCVTNEPRKNNNFNYPKVSKNATSPLFLVSNIQKTKYYVDGALIATGRRLNILIEPEKSYTITAKPEGYIEKEEFIQPPYSSLNRLSFTYLIGEKEYIPYLENDHEKNIYQEQNISISIGPSLIKNTYKKKIALVIGNGEYKNSPLKNPTNDAYDISNMLKKLGFDVISVFNASKKDMIKSINQFSKKLKKSDVGLFYYAGHGVQLKGVNYLIPINTNVQDESDVEFEGVNANRILAKMENADNKVNIVILDACRNNPFSRSYRSLNRGLARIDAPKGSFVVFATAPGSLALDGKGRNGVFTSHFLKNMSIENLKIEEVMKRVRNGVLSQTSNKQIPWQSSSLTGDFYFSRSKN